MERFLIGVLVVGFASAIPLPPQTELTLPFEEVVAFPVPQVEVEEVVVVIDESASPPPPETELTPPIKEAVDFLSQVVVEKVVLKETVVVEDVAVDIDPLMDDDAVVVSDIVVVVDESMSPPPPETELTPPIKEAVDFLSQVVVEKVVLQETVVVEDVAVDIDPLMDDDAVVVSDIVVVVDESMIPPPPETELTPPIKEAVDFLSPVVVEKVVVVADGDCDDLTPEIGEAEDEIDREFDRIEMEFLCSSKPDAPGCKDLVKLEQPTVNLPLEVTPEVSPIVAAKEVARDKRQVDLASKPSTYMPLPHYRLVRYCKVFRLNCEELLGLPEVPRADGYTVWLTKENALPSEWTEDWVQTVGKDRFTFPSGVRLQS